MSEIIYGLYEQIINGIINENLNKVANWEWNGKSITRSRIWSWLPRGPERRFSCVKLKLDCIV